MRGGRAADPGFPLGDALAGDTDHGGDVGLADAELFAAAAGVAGGEVADGCGGEGEVSGPHMISLGGVLCGAGILGV